MAESLAATLKLPAPFVDAVAVPETAPAALRCSPVTNALPVASALVTVPVPPMEASCAEKGHAVHTIWERGRGQVNVPADAAGARTANRLTGNAAASPAQNALRLRIGGFPPEEIVALGNELSRNLQWAGKSRGRPGEL